MAIVTQNFGVAFDDAAKATVIQGAVLINPPAQGVSIAINEADSYRQNEINTGIEQIRNRIIDNGLYEGDVAATLHFYMPIGAGDAGIVAEPVLGNIPDGVVVVSVAGNFRTLQRGSNVFQSMVTYCMDAMADNYLKLL